jgi:outer membrane protein assembly factor BamB
MKRFLIIGFLAFNVLGCSWFRGGESNLEPPAELKSFTPSAKVTKLWSHNVGKGVGKRYVLLSPAVSEHVVYVSDSQGQVSAYAAESGKRLWQVQVRQPIEAATGYGEGLVLVGTKNGTVVALQKEDGKQVWVNRASSEILMPPRVESGVVLVQTIDGKLTGMSAQDGKVLWVIERTVPALSLRGTSRPTPVANAVLTGFANGRLLAADVQSGRVLWEVPIVEPRGRNEIERLVDIDAPPVVNGKVVYAAAYQGRVVAINLESGQFLWSKELSTYSAMDSDATHLYVNDAKGDVYALDLATGAVVWKQEQLHGRTPSPPIAVGRYVVVGDFEGYVHWLNKEDGTIVARYRMSSHPILAQAVAGETAVYFLDQDADLVALRAEP